MQISFIKCIFDERVYPGMCPVLAAARVEANTFHRTRHSITIEHFDVDAGHLATALSENANGTNFYCSQYEKGFLQNNLSAICLLIRFYNF